MKRAILAALALAALHLPAAPAVEWSTPIPRVYRVVAGAGGAVVESGSHPGFAADADHALVADQSLDVDPKVRAATNALMQALGPADPAVTNAYGKAADAQRTREFVYEMFMLGSSRYFTGPGSQPFPSYAALTNAVATHDVTNNPTLFYNGAPEIPIRDDWCIVLEDETHGEPGATNSFPSTRWGWVGEFDETRTNGTFQYQIVLSGRSFTEEQMAALDSGVNTGIVAYVEFMRTNGVDSVSNAVWTASTNYVDSATNGLWTATTNLAATVSESATNYTEVVADLLYQTADEYFRRKDDLNVYDSCPGVSWTSTGAVVSAWSDMTSTNTWDLYSSGWTLNGTLTDIGGSRTRYSYVDAATGLSYESGTVAHFDVDIEILVAGYPVHFLREADATYYYAIDGLAVTSLVHSATNQTYIDHVPWTVDRSTNLTAVTVGERLDGDTVGEHSLVQGINGSVASGRASHAQGIEARAGGDAAHAEGRSVHAEGYASHAEGYGTGATNSYSHAEGSGSMALGEAAHAEGVWSEAHGSGAHAEGKLTKAFMEAAHAEGYGTLASNSYAHAEGGYGTRALGMFSHAEGESAVAEGQSAHAEGTGTLAAGHASHAEGMSCVASNVSAHAEGMFTKAAGDNAHAEGAYGVALGASAHAEGYQTLASNENSHAEGMFTVAAGVGSHAEGLYPVALGGYSHAEGSQTVASNSYSHAEGNLAVAAGAGSHAEGNGTLAAGEGAHAEGNGTVASGRAAHAEGDAAEAHGVAAHAEGSGARAFGDGSHAEGSDTVASNAFAHAEGDRSQALGSMSHAEGIETVASGYGAHADGVATVASGYGSRAGGYLSVASGAYSRADGVNSATSNLYSYAWSGTGSPYGSHGNGTYSVNPVGGLSGLWIGSTNLARHLDFRIPYALDSATNLTAMSIGGRDGGAVGPYSVSFGYNGAPGFASFAAGSENLASGTNAIALGQHAFATNDVSFAWSAAGTYGSRGDGTFSVNPYGAADGLWIGPTNLTGHMAASLVPATNALWTATTNAIANIPQADPTRLVSSDGTYWQYADGRVVGTNATGTSWVLESDPSVELTYVSGNEWALMDSPDSGDYIMYSNLDATVDKWWLGNKYKSYPSAPWTYSRIASVTGSVDDTRLTFDLGDSTYITVVRTAETTLRHVIHKGPDRFGSITAVTVGGRASGDVGMNSVAIGTDNLAGDNSMAVGLRNEATGQYALGAGNLNKVTGLYGIALGYNNKSLADGGMVIGFQSEASGDAAIAIGYQAKAKGSDSLATGSMTEATGYGARAGGVNTKASGKRAYAGGSKTRSEGHASVAIGVKSVAKATDGASFVWQGYTRSNTADDYTDGGAPDYYNSNGPGTFNVNPVGGQDGLYVGSASLRAVVNGNVNSAVTTNVVPRIAAAVDALEDSVDTKLAVKRDLRDDMCYSDGTYVRMDEWTTTPKPGFVSVTDPTYNPANGWWSMRGYTGTGGYTDESMPGAKDATYLNFSVGTATRPLRYYSVSNELFVTSSYVTNQVATRLDASATNDIYATIASSVQTASNALAAAKQDVLIPGENIGITNNVIYSTAASGSFVPWTTASDGTKSSILVGTLSSTFPTPGPKAISVGDNNIMENLGASLAIGENVQLYTPSSCTLASGANLISYGVGTTLLGQFAKADLYHSYSFTWSGERVGTSHYVSHGAGTFNVNPTGGARGFYVGSTNLYDLITSIGGGGGVDPAAVDAQIAQYNSTNLVGRFAAKQNTLTAGEGITISGDVISATGGGGTPLRSRTGTVGEVIWFSGPDAPTNFLFCDGRAVSRTVYAKLFAKVGVRYGIGDGIDTFNIPDLRDRFIEGKSDTVAVGTKHAPGIPNIWGEGGGVRGHSSDPMESPAAFRGAHVFTGVALGGFGGSGGLMTRLGFDAKSGEQKMNGALANDVYGKSDTVQPNALRMLPCIRFEEDDYYGGMPEQELKELIVDHNDVHFSNEVVQVAGAGGGGTAIAKSGVVGEIVWYSGSTPPQNFLACDGSDLSWDNPDYRELRDVIGITYGGVSGAYFKVPNLKKRFIEGSDTDPVGTQHSPGLPNITGDNLYTINNGAPTGAFRQDALNMYGTGTGSGSLKVGFSASRSNAIYGNSTTVQPNSLVLLPCIRYRKDDFIRGVSKAEIKSEIESELKPELKSEIEDEMAVRYSSSETKTGEYWVDGKPIYVKVVTVTPSSTEYTAAIGIPYGSDIVEIRSLIRSTNSHEWFPLPYCYAVGTSTGANWYGAVYVQDGNATVGPNLKFQLGSGIYGSTSYIRTIVKYTKP